MCQTRIGKKQVLDISDFVTQKCSRSPLHTDCGISTSAKPRKLPLALACRHYHYKIVINGKPNFLSARNRQRGARAATNFDSRFNCCHRGDLIGREDNANGKWNYEVVVRTNGKESAFEVDPNGKFLKEQTQIKDNPESVRCGFMSALSGTLPS